MVRSDWQPIYARRHKEEQYRDSLQSRAVPAASACSHAKVLRSLQLGVS